MPKPDSMLEPLVIPNAYVWSRPQRERSMCANGYLFTSPAGNVAVDPLPLDDASQRRVEELGGLAAIAVTGPSRMRGTQKLAERYGAAIVSAPQHDEEFFPGMRAIALQHQSVPGTFAVHVEEHRTVVVGDALLGTPAGSLSMLPEERYDSIRAAALGLRRILRVNPETLLLGHGQSIFRGAYEVLYGLLVAHAGAEVHRINVDELDFRDERDERGQPSHYACLDAEVGFAIGARTLGYRVSTLQPGHRFCPLHGHAREEELFFVLDGNPSVRTLSGTVRCRKGDFIALPTGGTGTHQLLNESDAPATVLLLARTEGTEACYYPDSDKLLVDTEVPLVNGRLSVMVQGSPQLEYFHGEI
jgi:uncharacterized cupin superfamily protein